MSNPVAEVLSAIVSPANKLIDAISKGIGTLYEPHRLKKLADAEAYRIKTIGQALSENTDLPVQYNNGEISVDLTEYESLQKRAVCRFARQETQRQFNLENIADKAYDLLKDQQPQSDETVSQDWMTRFINNAQDVSDEDVQNLWSRILADEIVRPTSISIKTLDVIKNLSKEDAFLFEKISKHVINGQYLLRDAEFLSYVNITYNDILKLDDCGLINSSGFIHQDRESDVKFLPVAYNSSYVLFAQSDKKQKIKIPSYVLTNSGQELLAILKISTDNDSFSFCSKIIKESNKKSNWKMCKINGRYEDGALDVDETIDLLSEEQKGEAS